MIDEKYCKLKQQKRRKKSSNDCLAKLGTSEDNHCFSFEPIMNYTYLCFAQRIIEQLINMCVSGFLFNNFIVVYFDRCCCVLLLLPVSSIDD